MYKGLSLHIGVDKLSTKWYRSEAALCSPENDARAMADLARQEGYGQIGLLMREQATTDNFTRHFLRCAAALNAGDTLLLTFSGHGGQVDDIDGDEMDGKDETWCFYDKHLLDDDIGALWKEFKAGVNIIVVSASCHSRSALKPYPVSLPPWQTAGTTKTIRPPVVFAYRDDPEIKANILHLSACDDRQEARDGEYYSQFTKLLLKAWDNGRFNGTYEDLARQINREAGYLQTSGVALMGNNAERLLNATPFKLINY